MKNAENRRGDFMRKLLAIIVCTALLSVSSTITSFASDVDGTDVFSISIDNNVNPQMLTVSGQITGAYRVVTLQILQSDVSISDIQNPVNNTSVIGQILHFRETLSGLDGNFIFPSFPQTTQSGTFIARIAVEGESVVYAQTYRFFSIGEIDDFLENARSMAPNNAAGLQDEIMARGERLGFDERFEALGPDDRLAVATILLADNARAPIFNTPNDFSAAFDRAYAVQNFNMNRAGVNVPTLFERFSDVIDRTALPVYVTYSNNNVISATTRTLVHNAMANRGNYVFVSDVLDFFTERVILLGNQHAENILQVNTILGTNYQAIGIAFNPNHRNDVLTAVINRTFNNLEAYRVAIMHAINNPTGTPGGPNVVTPPGGGGGGGGGGLGGGTQIVSPELLGPTNVPLPPAEDVVSVFADVSDLLWAIDAVNNLFERGVISGRPDGTFDPDNTITREEFTKMIVHAAGIQNNYASADFYDVQPTNWAYAYVGAAVEAGLINGVGDGYFGFGQNITREDMAVIMYRVASNMGMDIQPTEHTFNDGHAISEHAENAVNAAFSLGLINGVGGNMFNPRGDATRAQAAVIIHRFIQEAGV